MENKNLSPTDLTNLKELFNENYLLIKQIKDYERKISALERPGAARRRKRNERAKMGYSLVLFYHRSASDDDRRAADPVRRSYAV